jgi:hypothetical protein
VWAHASYFLLRNIRKSCTLCDVDKALLSFTFGVARWIGWATLLAVEER